MDELTPEQKKLIVSLKDNEAFQLLQKMVDEIYDETKNQILVQAENYSAVKSHGYTIYEILGAFNNGLKTYESIVKELSEEDEVEKAVDEVNKSEEVA
jgi:hypothetical protein